jgi:hypothetical protein
MIDVTTDKIPTYTYSQKVKLSKNIKTLGKKEMRGILRILLDNDIKVTSNYTGSFFSLKHVSNDILHKVMQFVNFCLTNRLEEEKNDRLKLEYRQEMKNDMYKTTQMQSNNAEQLASLYQKYSEVTYETDSIDMCSNTLSANKSNTSDTKKKKVLKSDNIDIDIDMDIELNMPTNTVSSTGDINDNIPDTENSIDISAAENTIDYVDDSITKTDDYSDGDEENEDTDNSSDEEDEEDEDDEDDDSEN